MTQANQKRFTAYAHQRLFRLLTDLVHDTRSLSWSRLADRITEWRNVKFQRMSFYRLRDGNLDGNNVEIIVAYMEAHHDADIRARLEPSSIINEMALAARDYFFHIPEPNDIEDWNEQILEEFSGVYFCVHANMVESYLPSSYLRKRMEKESLTSNAGIARSGTAGTLFITRSVLVLQPTHLGYFYAAELPLSAFLPSRMKTTCHREYYEGVAVVSGNTIQVKLRDCLTRIPRTHAIAIVEKYDNAKTNPHGLSFQLMDKRKEVTQAWSKLSKEDIAALKTEHERAIKSEYFLHGPLSYTPTPLSSLSTKVGKIIASDMAYFPKPSEFLENLNDHFALGEFLNEDSLRKIVENPLVIGTLS